MGMLLLQGPMHDWEKRMKHFTGWRRDFNTETATCHTSGLTRHSTLSALIRASKNLCAESACLSKYQRESAAVPKSGNNRFPPDCFPNKTSSLNAKDRGGRREEATKDGNEEAHLPEHGSKLHARELRKGVKVTITGEQNQRVLQDQCGDPHIVCRNGRPLLAQLPVNSGVMMSRLLVRIEHPDTRLQQETAEDRFVVRTLVADGEAGAQFSQNDKWQPDFVG